VPDERGRESAMTNQRRRLQQDQVRARDLTHGISHFDPLHVGTILCDLVS
jgi:hypothetical protein